MRGEEGLEAWGELEVDIFILVIYLLARGLYLFE